MNKEKYYQKLIQLQKKSYCPYSKYPVACILVANNDKEYYGVNVENSSYGLSICAERTAIGNMVSDGAKEIKEIHILCGLDNTNYFASACGACRQVISEFISEDGLIYLWNHNQEFQVFKMSEYLPHYFTNKFLKE